MTFIVIFLIMYGLGIGICQLAAMLFSGTDASLIKNIGFVPILNIIASVLIIFFMFYIVRDYRKNNREDKKPETAQN